MKKILLSLATLAATASPLATVVACGNNESSRVSAASADIGIWGMKPEQQKEADLLAAQATKDLSTEEKAVTYGWDMVGGARDYGAELAAVINGDSAPALFSAENSENAWLYEEKSLNFEGNASGKSYETQFNKLKSLIENSPTLKSEDGSETIGIPVTMEAYGSFVNVNAFEKMNIEIVYGNEDNAFLNNWDGEAFTTEQELNAYSMDSTDWTNLFKGFGDDSFIYTVTPGHEWVINHTLNAAVGAIHDLDASIDWSASADVLTDPVMDELEAAFTSYHGFMSNVETFDSASIKVGAEIAVGMQQGNWAVGTTEQNHFALLPLPLDSENGAGTIPVGVPQYWQLNETLGEEVVGQTIDYLLWMYEGEGKTMFAKDMELLNPYVTDDTTAVTTNSILSSAANYIDDGQTRDWVMSNFPANFSNNNATLTDALRAYAAANVTDYDTFESAIKSAYTTA